MQPDANAIIQRSVAVNNRDWGAAPNFNYFEIDRTSQGTSTYEVTMILGSPYSRLVAVNGKPLSPQDEETEQQKLDQTIARRKAESPGQRARRIAKYQRGRQQDHLLIEQLAKAFVFKLQGEQKVAGYDAYVLQATPRLEYRPPTLETQVLKGMVGRLWIEKNTFQWVKVEAKVIHPVSIEGFLACVEPGTRFELENVPVAPGVWLTKHFSMRSRSKILFLFPRRGEQDETYFGYRRSADRTRPAHGSEGPNIPANLTVRRIQPAGPTMRPYV
jgi:hypothetical protein